MKNESIPPDEARFCVASGTGLSDLGTIFQPAGATSCCVMSGLALIDASHVVDPFEFMYIATGPFDVRCACLVNFRASTRRLEVKVWGKGSAKGRLSSSGTIFSAEEFRFKL